MELHPQARAALGVQHREPLTVENLGEVRRSMRDATPAEVGPGPRLQSVSSFTVDRVPVRLYTPAPPGPAAAAAVGGAVGGGVAGGSGSGGAGGGRSLIVYAHGGGWVMGDLDTHDGLCRQLAATSGWSVLAVDYRLAPEHPHPAALDDVERALSWSRSEGFTRTAIAGDSSGGHLAATAAHRARDAGTPLAAQILICPVLDPAMTYPALDDYGLHRDEMRFFWDAYAPPPTDRTHPDLNPFHADPSGLPPTVIISAELDILRDEADRYAARLMTAGVPVVAASYQGLIHNFPRKLALFDAASAAVGQIAGFLSLI